MVELLCRVATVNDLHFGETECGRIDDHEGGPILHVEPGEPPYAETMNRAAAAEIAAIEPDAVIVKGDLSNDGTGDEWAAFEACYRVRVRRPTPCRARQPRRLPRPARVRR